MTKQQAMILRFIRDFWTDHGYSPSYNNIAEGTGLASRGNVHRHVHALQERGYLAISAGRARGIRLTDQSHGAVGQAG